VLLGDIFDFWRRSDSDLLASAIVRSLGDIFALVGSGLESLVKFVPNLTVEHTNMIRKIMYDFLYVAIILASYWLLSLLIQ
jgi:hypothetical protein